MRQGSRSLVVRLKGGLGNQYFQYAFGRALTLRHAMRLVLDTRSGFIRDKEFGRSFALEPLELQFEPASSADIIRFLAADFEKKISTKINTRTRECKESYISDSNLNYSEAVPGSGRRLLAEGFWQSHLYFADFIDEIKADLFPPRPNDPDTLDLGAKISESNSIAVGIRAYEESTSPQSNFRGPRNKSLTQIQNATQKLASQMNAERLFVFSTLRSELLDPNGLWPLKPTFVLPSTHKTSDLDSLWLFAQSNCHVITASSFYWWGAFLKSPKLGRESTTLAADNFINESAIPHEWGQF